MSPKYSATPTVGSGISTSSVPSTNVIVAASPSAPMPPTITKEKTVPTASFMVRIRSAELRCRWSWYGART